MMEDLALQLEGLFDYWLDNQVEVEVQKIVGDLKCVIIRMGNDEVAIYKTNLIETLMFNLGEFLGRNKVNPVIWQQLRPEAYSILYNFLIEDPLDVIV